MQPGSPAAVAGVEDDRADAEAELAGHRVAGRQGIGRS